jgi:hypothetical protein
VPLDTALRVGFALGVADDDQTCRHGVGKKRRPSGVAPPSIRTEACKAGSACLAWGVR